MCSKKVSRVRKISGLGNDGYYQVSELSPWTPATAVQELDGKVAAPGERLAGIEGKQAYGAMSERERYIPL
ncbi:MAG: hypothetical protein HYY37_03280 [Candidatus Aenigmarchaeota archaeon]|nr:hypothetical protein [Candidatus Aenigmarchaeota archaeon]